MIRNEKGSSLIQVLLVIIVFSVLGLALMGSVIGENKRTYKTETNMQARYLAESGLTYFEKAYIDSYNKELDTFIALNKNKLTKSALTDFNNKFFSDILVKYATFQKAGSEKIKVKAKVGKDASNNDILVVTSKGTASETNEEILTGRYLPCFDIKVEDIIYKFAEFPPGGKAIDFSDVQVLGLGLGDIVQLDVLKQSGEDNKYYPVPNDGVATVKLPILGVNIQDGESFIAMKENRVIATRQGTNLLELGLVSKSINAKVNIFDEEIKKNTNVIINGGYTSVDLLVPIGRTYQDIYFKKLGVMGNTVIKQERWGNVDLLEEADLYTLLKKVKLPLVLELLEKTGALRLLNLGELINLLGINDLLSLLQVPRDGAGPRTFTFEESLVVSKSLTIGSVRKRGGNTEPISNLKLRGNIGVDKDLYITDVNLDYGQLGINKAIYVKGNTVIKNACVNANKLKYPESLDLDKDKAFSEQDIDKYDYYGFRIFSQGNITFDSINPSCNKFRGIFVANEINIKSNSKIIIEGAIIGNIVGNKDKLEYIPDEELLKKVVKYGLELKAKGRTFSEDE